MIYGKLINNTPPTGFRWQVVTRDGNVVKSGTTETKAEAEVAAEKAVADLTAADQKSQKPA